METCISVENKIIEELQSRGYDIADGGYSGGVLVNMKDGTQWAFGTANGENWGGTLVDDDGEVLANVDFIYKVDCEDWRSILTRIVRQVGSKYNRVRSERRSVKQELLDVLKEVDDFWTGGDCPEELHAKMRAAIRRAIEE